MSKNMKLVQDVVYSSPDVESKSKAKSEVWKPMKNDPVISQNSLLCLKAMVLSLAIVIPFCMSGAIVYTTYSLEVLKHRHELDLTTLERKLDMMNQVIQEIDAKQVKCNEILAKREYNAKKKEDNAFPEFQALIERQKNKKTRNDYQYRNERSASQFRYPKCSTADVTIYEEFRSSARSRTAGLTNNLGNWTGDCKSDNFYVRMAVENLKIFFKVAGVYLIRVQLTLKDLNNSRVQLQLDVDGNSWRKCIHQGGRYATCVLSGVRKMNRDSHISLSSSMRPINIIHNVEELTHIEIVKIMNG